MIRPLTLKTKQTPKPSSYLLEVVSVEPKKRVQQGKTRGGFSIIKNIFVALLLGMFFITGTGTAALAGTTNQETANAVDLFNPGTWICPYKDNPGAYLDGISGTIEHGLNDSTRDPANGAGFNITIQSSNTNNPYSNEDRRPKSGAQWTALEQYGYFAPSFENWKGLLYEDIYDESVWPFVGTGGGGNSSFGDTVAVNNGARSLLLNSGAGSCIGDSFGTGFSVGFANGLFSVTKFMTMLAGETYGIAMNMDITNETSPLHGLAVGIEELIVGSPDNPDSGLKNLLYLDWLVGIIFVATFWLIWVGIVRRSFLAAGQAIFWMLGASVGGIILLTNPLMVPAFIDDVASNVSASVSSAIIPANSSSSDICNVPSGGDAGDSSIRQVKCSLWYMTVYTPWVKGQFGVNEYDLASDSSTTGWMYRDNYTSSRPGAESNASPWNAGDLQGEGFKEVEDPTNASNMNSSRGVLSKANIRFGDYSYQGEVNWAIYMLDRQNNWETNRGLDYSEIAFNQLVVNENDIWKGAGDGVGSAMMSLFSAMGPTVLMLFMSLTLIGLQLSMLFLIALSPLFFLVGVAPGWGRRIAMRWLELVVGILAKRIILTIFLILFLQIYFLIVRSDIDWWIQSIIVLVLSIVAFTHRDKVTGIFNDAINFGGDKRFDDGRRSLQSSKQQVIEKGDKAIRNTGRVVSWVGSRGGAKNAAQKAATAGAAGAGAGAAATAAAKKAGNAPGAPGTGTATSTKTRSRKPAEGTPGAPGATPVPVTRKENRAQARSKAQAEHREFNKRTWEDRKPAKRSVEVRKRQFVDQQNKLHKERVANKEAIAKLEQEKVNGTISNATYAQEKQKLYAQRSDLKAATKNSKLAYDKDIKKIEARSQRADRRIDKNFEKSWRRNPGA